MERFVKMLYDRLEKKKPLQLQLFVIMQNAINEMHNHGIIASLTGETAKMVHDPDPEVRVREKTSLAKAVGKQFIPSTMPVPAQGGLSYLANVNYDPKFVNSITLCIQGGIEGLHMMFASNDNLRLDKYIVQVVANGNDLSALKKNMELLDQMYDDISIVVMADGKIVVPESEIAPSVSSAEKKSTPEMKKKGFFSKLFGRN